MRRPRVGTPGLTSRDPPPAGVVVRPAVLPAELPEIRALFLEYAASLGVDLGFQDFAHELATLPGEYVPPRGALLVAELDGAIGGCAALRPLDGDACEMKRLFVRGTLRGRGAGHALVLALMDEAHRIGYARMRLDTLPSMGAAIRLYEALGFTDIPPYRHNPVPGTRWLERLLR